MASVASQLIDEVTAHAQSDSLEDAREICADGTYFPNNLRITYKQSNPITGLDRPRGSQEVEVSILQDNRHIEPDQYNP